ncbi:MAG: hypothetical protein H6867_04600 [Rhodospirillales bacterium]|nr:hypothetical protein [Rhodospirillales bacterium]MCB9996430.1 hypothetical protein [Rhodospirillales bacterium]
MTGLTAVKAVNLFKAFRKNALLMAGLHTAGCDYRAHLMGAFLQEKTGHKAGKIWLWSEEDMIDAGDENFLAEDSLISFSPAFHGAHRDDYNWNFHVAAMLNAGDEEILVFDPVHYDGPVTLAQYESDFTAMNDHELVVTYTGLDVHKIYADEKNLYSIEEEKGFAEIAKYALRTLFNKQANPDEKKSIIDKHQVYGRSKWLRTQPEAIRIRLAL